LQYHRGQVTDSMPIAPHLTWCTLMTYARLPLKVPKTNASIRLALWRLNLSAHNTLWCQLIINLRLNQIQNATEKCAQMYNLHELHCSNRQPKQIRITHQLTAARVCCKVPNPDVPILITWYQLSLQKLTNNPKPKKPFSFYHDWRQAKKRDSANPIPGHQFFSTQINRK
jgi:hypothetical protein